MKRFLQLSVVAVALASSLLTTFAGRVPTPGADSQLVAGHQSIIYNNEWFQGGELAVITVSGDGDSDLDLYVYDQNGNLIVCDVDYTDQCRVTFVPRWSGRFTVKVVNAGNHADLYELRTN